MFGASKWIAELECGHTQHVRHPRRWLFAIGLIMKKVERKGWELFLLVRFVTPNHLTV
jgi:hypothetical protein